MSNSKPVWLLDVDGVVNRYFARPQEWDEDARYGHAFHTVGGMTMNVYWGVPVVEFINAAAEFVDVVWLTSWGVTANTELVPMAGLAGPFPVGSVLAGLPSPDPGVSFLGHKVDVVLELFTETAGNGGEPLFGGRRVVWSDDELSADVRGGVSVAFGDRVGDVLFVRPGYHVGLTPQHLNQIRSFVGF